MDIILIGMPGCGKTTIGKYLARHMNMEFVDIDKEIERREKRKIPEIFASDGEFYFRSCETECLGAVLGLGRVISTGGGVVVTETNFEVLNKSNNLIIFIDRPIENIMSDVRSDTRPLLREGRERLVELYNERYHKYMRMCHIRIENTGTINDVVQKITDEVNDYENNDN